MPHSSQIPPELKAQAEDPTSRDNREPTSLAFRLLIAFAAVFCVTVLASMTLVFSAESTPASRWLDRHLAAIVTVEFAGIGLCLILGIVQNRRKNWKTYERQLTAYEARMAADRPASITKDSIPESPETPVDRPQAGDGPLASDGQPS